MKEFRIYYKTIGVTTKKTPSMNIAADSAEEAIEFFQGAPLHELYRSYFRRLSNHPKAYQLTIIGNSVIIIVERIIRRQSP